jgi:hypothetical protein
VWTSNQGATRGWVLNRLASPPSVPATASFQELLKPVAQQPAQVWDVNLFDSHEKKSHDEFTVTQL